MPGHFRKPPPAGNRLPPPRPGAGRMHRLSSLLRGVPAARMGRSAAMAAAAAGSGGGRRAVVAQLLLVVLQLAGSCGAGTTAALPVVINTWAFRKATETGAPAGGSAAPCGVVVAAGCCPCCALHADGLVGLQGASGALKQKKKNAG